MKICVILLSIIETKNQISTSFDSKRHTPKRSKNPMTTFVSSKVGIVFAAGRQAGRQAVISAAFGVPKTILQAKSSA